MEGDQVNDHRRVATAAAVGPGNGQLPIPLAQDGYIEIGFRLEAPMPALAK